MRLFIENARSAYSDTRPPNGASPDGLTGVLPGSGRAGGRKRRLSARGRPHVSTRRRSTEATISAPAACPAGAPAPAAYAVGPAGPTASSGRGNGSPRMVSTRRGMRRIPRWRAGAPTGAVRPLATEAGARERSGRRIVSGGTDVGTGGASTRAAGAAAAVGRASTSTRGAMAVREASRSEAVATAVGSPVDGGTASTSARTSTSARITRQRPNRRGELGVRLVALVRP